jgi:GTP-binding protein
MFVDKVTLIVASGKGGKGAVAFRREKYVPKGGPDGGDGGNGGDVILRVDGNINNLYQLRHTPTIRSGDGKPGKGKKMHGKNGKHAIINIPPGTSVYDEQGTLLFDMVTPGEERSIARGGKGGKGNVHFATAKRQVPEFSTQGQPGEEKRIVLELKAIADVGIVGYPNVGKSTLLKAISSATPKIADYPFTTLTPNLGVVVFDDYSRLIFADIPGVIKGASGGKGLGLAFLRHIERTRVLLIMLDATSKTIEPDYLAILNELNAYSRQFEHYPKVIALNKMDLVDVELPNPELGKEVYPISALKRDGIAPLLAKIKEIFANREV